MTLAALALVTVGLRPSTAGNTAAAPAVPAPSLDPGALLASARRVPPPASSPPQAAPATTPPATIPPATTPPAQESTTTTPPAPKPTTTTSTAPAGGCAAALAYLAAHSAPGFSFECPGYALGRQAMTCVNVAGVCPGARLIAIAVACPASWMNEASNSWVLTGRSRAAIDPYGYCH